MLKYWPFSSPFSPYDFAPNSLRFPIQWFWRRYPMVSHRLSNGLRVAIHWRARAIPMDSASKTIGWEIGRQGPDFRYLPEILQSAKG